ncbi:MAG TPA: acyltransferase [Solirubrobacteraceae bacterium]|nr:acyltransferase [Solirubrobacteraceae bacterium]
MDGAQEARKVVPLVEERDDHGEPGSGDTIVARGLRLLRSLLDVRAYAHLFRLLHYWNYAHVTPRRQARIGSGVWLAPNVSFRNGERIEIGARSHIGEQSSLWAGDSRGRITIGEDALFGPRVYITASNYRYDTGSPVWAQPRIEEDVVIGADVWLGARVIVLPGVTVGDGTIVAAGSVVTKDLPPGVVAAGVPARVLKRRDGSPAH